MADIYLAIVLTLMASNVTNHDSMKKDWQIVEGSSSAWNFQADEIECEIVNDGLHRILSEKIISGDWIIETEIEHINYSSQSIHFSIAEDYSYGYILTLENSELILRRIATDNEQDNWIQSITSNPVRADILAYGTSNYEIEIDNFTLASPDVSSITDDFESGLAQWNQYDGQATTQGGRLRLGNDGIMAHNEGVQTIDRILPNEYLEASVQVNSVSGDGGCQIDFRLIPENNQSGYLGIQRRFNQFGSEFIFKVMPGWDLPPISVPNHARKFNLKITCDRSTGISAGYYNLLDETGWIKIGDTKMLQMSRTLVKIWKIPKTKLRPRFNKFNILKRGATYAFRLNDHMIGTITNPKLQGAIQINNLYEFPEPNKGRYGLSFTNKGKYRIPKFQIWPIPSVKKYEGNPILSSKEASGAWDENQAFPATIKKFGETYYLYYTGIDNTDSRLEGGGIGRIGLATSYDGYHFEKYEQNPIFERVIPNSHQPLKIQGMSLVKEPNERYALTYTVWDNDRWIRLEYAIGNSPYGPFNLGLNNPLIKTSKPPGFDETHIHLHNLIRQLDGSFIMIYTGFGRVLDRWGDRGGLAMSEDFVKWTKYPDNPVFPLGESGAWDDAHVRPKGIIKYGDYHYMFYEGAHYAEHVALWFDQVGMARSKDLIHWERYPYNPIIPIDAGGGRDTLVTEWPIPIETESGLAIFYWGGMPGNVGISRADICKDLLDGWE